MVAVLYRSAARSLLKIQKRLYLLYLCGTCPEYMMDRHELRVTIC